MQKICMVFLLACMVFGCVKQEQASNFADVHALGAPRPEFSTPVTQEELRTAYYNYSLVSIVAVLRENGGANWRMIQEKVAAGDKDWIISFRTYVLAGVDASVMPEVTETLAYALSTNPNAILSFGYRAGPTLYSICGLPFVDAEYEFLMDYSQRTLAALRKVDDDKLEVRDECVRRLQESLEHHKQRQKPRQ